MTAPQYNAWREEARDYAEYLFRIEQVPEGLRDSVIRHCQLVSTLKQRTAQRIADRNRRRAKLGLGPT